MQTLTLHMPKRRSEWFWDYDGVWTTSKDSDAVLDYAFDFTHSLDSGETISSISWSASGVTISSESNTTTTAEIRVTGTGEATATITTSAGREITPRLRWLPTDTGTDGYA